MWTSARRGLVDFVNEWSGMKCSANVVCGWVDLFATAAGKVDGVELRRESMEWEKERAYTIELCICVVCCCWNLQLSWSVGSGEGTFAGIVVIAAEIAGQKAECRAVLLVVCHCGQSKKKCSASWRFRGKICDWTVDFGLLLLTSGVFHSHSGIVWKWVE